MKWWIGGFCIAMASGSGWIADKKGCKVFNEAPHDGEAIVWSGACQNGYAEGPGEVRWVLDSVFSEVHTGTYHAGAPVEGEIVRFFDLKRGITTEVPWKNGALNGK